MNEDKDEPVLDNQDDINVAPSGNEDQNLNDDGNQGDDDQGADDDQGIQSRQERRRERFESFQAARQGFDEAGNQRDRENRRDPYNPMPIQKDTEYDVEQLEKDRNQYGDSRYAEGVAQQRFYDTQERYYDRLEIDSESIANKYSFLDEESDDFDPELNANINKLFFKAAGYDAKGHVFRNTDVRYRDFVKDYVKALEKFAATRNADSAVNLESQRSRTGVRPTSGGRKPVVVRDVHPSEMTDEELQAAIKQQLRR